MTNNYTEEQMKIKMGELEDYLTDFDKKYAEQVKEKGGIRHYFGYGRGHNDITYAFYEGFPEHLQKEILEKLREIFPNTKS